MQNILDKNEFEKINRKYVGAFSKFKKLTSIPARLKKDKTLSDLRIYIGLLKVPQVVEDVEKYVIDGQSVVIFCIHHEVLNRYKKIYGTDAYYISGKTSATDRTKFVKAFQNGKKKIIVLTMGAGKEGLTLTKSSVMCVTEIDWEAVVMNQSFDRIHRCGQTKDCEIRIYFVPKTIDEYILGLLNYKTNISNILL
jgi:SNF2 family DNA or RNA helicase